MKLFWWFALVGIGVVAMADDEYDDYYYDDDYDRDSGKFIKNLTKELTKINYEKKIVEETFCSRICSSSTKIFQKIFD